MFKKKYKDSRANSASEFHSRANSASEFHSRANSASEFHSRDNSASNRRLYEMAEPVTPIVVTVNTKDNISY